MGLQDSLYDLFLVDQQVRGLEQRLVSSKRYLAAQQRKLDELDEQMRELNEQLLQTKASEANLESEASGFEDRINSLREQMNSAKNNKEYSAFLVEVNTLKVEKEKVEEGAIELIARIEALEAEIAELATQREDQTKLVAHGQQEVVNREEEVGDQLAQVKEKRASAARNVPDTALSLFDKLADDTDGEPMCEMEVEDHRRMEYNCSGCYMQLPVEVVNQLMVSDQVIQCPSCKRILFATKKVKDAMGIGN